MCAVWGWGRWLLIFGGILPLVTAKCIIHDVCHVSGINKFNCIANGTYVNPSSGLNEEAKIALRKICPYMYDKDDDVDVCCSSAQVFVLQDQLNKAAALISKCPSCYDNFKKLWCEYTCSSRQSDFVEILSTEKTSADVEYVVGVKYNISRAFVEGLHSSCKDVVGVGSTKALTMMCLSPNDDGFCPLDQWLGFIGKRNLPMGIPIETQFNLVTDEKAMSIPWTPCHDSPRFGVSACSRQDCSTVNASINFDKDHGTKESCQIWGVGCSFWYLLVVAAVSSVFFLCCLCSQACEQKQHVVFDGDEIDFEQPVGTITVLAVWIERQIRLNCIMYGEFVGSHPGLVLAVGLSLMVVCSSSCFFVRQSVDPIELWTSESSISREHMRTIQRNFGASDRYEHVILVPKRRSGAKYSAPNTTVDGHVLGPVFDKKFLAAAFRLVNRISEIRARDDYGRLVTLDDVCARPLGKEHRCVIMSPTEYFQNDVTLLNTTKELSAANIEQEVDYFDYDAEPVEEAQKMTYMHHFIDCMKNPMNVESRLGLNCLGNYGGPIIPEVVFGGNPTELTQSSAISMIFLLDGDARYSNKVLAWEQSFISLMRDYKSDVVQVSFMSGRSISDEIERESESDVITVLLSVVLMICFSIFSLGYYAVHNNRLLTLLVHSKVMLGLGGVFSLALCNMSAIGLVSLYGQVAPASAIIVQVYVVLSIGVSRMFFMVREVQKADDTDEKMAKKIGRVCGKALPLFLNLAIVESVIFCVASRVDVPAVRCFTLFMAVSVVLEFFTHCAIFIPIMIFDLKREQNGRLDLLCFLRYDIDVDEGRFERGYIKGLMQSCARVIMHPWPRRIVMAVGFLAAFLSPFGYRYVPLGLDKKMSVPEDSYVTMHFNNLDKYMNVGPPVMFVVEGELDLEKADVQNKFCTIGGCRGDSVGAILTEASHYSNVTYLQGKPLNWVDNYLQWLSSDNGNLCCRLKKNESSLCDVTDPASDCRPCDSQPSKGRPSEKAFLEYIERFQASAPNPQCVHGGLAAFRNAIWKDNLGRPGSFYFLTYHVPLKTSSDILNAMEGARMVARRIAQLFDQKVRVFAFSEVYVYYDQYLTIQVEASYLLIMSFVAMFLSNCIMSGLDPWSSIICVVVSLFHLISIVSMMAIWQIEFNPLTAVNLITVVGSSTEFIVPIATAYRASMKPTKKERAKEALVDAGSVVLSGITACMIIGVLVLAFAHSQFIKLYIFRMFLGLALSAAFHSVFFLPVLLSYIGPPVSRTKMYARKADEKKMTERETQTRLGQLSPNSSLASTPPRKTASLRAVAAAQASSRISASLSSGRLPDVLSPLLIDNKKEKEEVSRASSPNSYDQGVDRIG